MNKRNSRWITYVFGGAMLAALAAYPLADRSAMAEEYRNPRIYHAIDALRDAQDELERTHRDYHGKKRDAMDAIDRAIHKLDEIKDW
jgi:ribulose kinase